jgi:hypothetical protein
MARNAPLVESLGRRGRPGVAVLGFFVVTLDALVVNVALPCRI